jgi:hypothetical protein
MDSTVDHCVQRRGTGVPQGPTDRAACPHAPTWGVTQTAARAKVKDARSGKPVINQSWSPFALNSLAGKPAPRHAAAATNPARATKGYA